MSPSTDSAPSAFARVLTGEGSLIGGGEIGGKAAGLRRASDALAARFPTGRWGPFRIAVPEWTVLGTGLFHEFVFRNSLDSLGLEEDEETVARAFLHAPFPATVSGDLWALAAAQHVPLAVRSSSLLEDALRHPLAGVYVTKMTPNDQPAPEARFARLVEAIKLVWASSFFPSARAARAGFGIGEGELMAVVLQSVVGRRHGDRFYPDFSGVARSFSFYRFAGARPEEGVVQLALGLGKTIVDGGVSWRFVPTRPKAPAPFSSVKERLDATQRAFWAVRMGEPAAHDPLRETEYLAHETLAEAEADDTLGLAVSTYDGARDRFVPGLGVGARCVDFAPVLVHDALPLAALVREVLSTCEEALGEPVEIEFAISLANDDPLFGLVQLRPLHVAAAEVDVADQRPGWKLLVRSACVLGNGVSRDAADVVSMRRDIDPARFRDVTSELRTLDRALRDAHRPYVLVVFGRLGSSDPWLGVPAAWGDVAGARAIVEASLAGRPVEMSEGSHLFHNLAAANVPYFSVSDLEGEIDWAGLEAEPALWATPLLRHVRLPQPLRIEVDGRSGRGAIFRAEET